MSRRRPQVLPTRYIRGFTHSALRLLDRLPLSDLVLRPKQSVESSEEPVTIVLPLHAKDMWIAPFALKFAKKNIRHPVKDILVISARDRSILEWTEQHQIRHVDENHVLGYRKAQVEECMPEHARGRGGWVFQQLLKFAADQYVETPGFLVLDSDTLLLQPWVFKSGQHLWVDFSHERNLLYLRSYRKLLGDSPVKALSLVCHHMFIEKEVLSALKQRIESKAGCRWDQAIIALADDPAWTPEDKKRQPFNYFSEYETYGNFACSLAHRSVRLSYFRNHSAKEYSPKSGSPEHYVKTLPKFFKWASFHSYYQYDFGPSQHAGGPNAEASEPSSSPA